MNDLSRIDQFNDPDFPEVTREEEAAYEANYEMAESGHAPDCYIAPPSGGALQDRRAWQLVQWVGLAEETLIEIGMAYGDFKAGKLDAPSFGEDIAKALVPYWKKYAEQQAAEEMGAIADVGKP